MQKKIDEYAETHSRKTTHELLLKIKYDPIQSIKVKANSCIFSFDGFKQSERLADLLNY